MDESFVIEGLGGKKALKGSIRVRGAKNAALKVMAASLLFEDELRLENVPDIEDISRTRELLKKLGADVKNGGTTYTIDTGAVSSTELDKEISKRMRASIVLMGPLLGRFGEVSLPHPGGCVIGERPIDLFLDGFERMGAELIDSNGFYTLKSKDGKLHGAEIFLRIQSVTATETLMLAAILAEGTTVIKNAPQEPEIVSLANFLTECGANIEGVGTSTITINGNGMLSAEGKTYHTIPDRLEAGSFLILGALAAEELTVTHCNPAHLEIVTSMLRDAGVNIEENQEEGTLTVRNARENGKPFKAFNVKTHEYPGFPTDVQAPATVFLTQAEGEALVFETIYEGRLSYTEDLIRMGADILMFDPHRVQVKGPTRLKGKEMYGPDIRAGLAFIIAGIIAEGESTIHNAYFIDRGYEAIESRLRDIGVNISRISR